MKKDACLDRAADLYAAALLDPTSKRSECDESQDKAGAARVG